MLAAITVDGYLTTLRLVVEASQLILEQIHSVFVESNLKALAWSPDGSLLTTGGRDKELHVFSASDLKRNQKPVELDGRIWDIDLTNLLLTVKLLSYLRGLGDTGWLVSVLVANLREEAS